jgi:hypothetical protein
MIFPEGTTCSGINLMKFNRGPFVDPSCLVKVFALKYKSKVSPCMDLIDDIYSALLPFLQFVNYLEIHEVVEPVD